MNNQGPDALEILHQPTDPAALEQVKRFGDDAFCIFGDYVVLEHREEPSRPYRLGEGAFGVTYKARHTILEEEVALKVLKFEKDDKRFTRFVREAKALDKLYHPNIAAYKYVGVYQGTPYCAMEFCGGGSLRQAAQAREGGVSAQYLLLIGKQLCAALSHAHEKNLVHRDIKPDNVMIGHLESSELAIKLIDFGLAKAFMDDGGESNTVVSRDGFKGTMLFASPEQFRERQIDARTDLYSLGMTLWYLHVGGKPAPFEGKSEAEVSVLHLEAAPHDLSQVDPWLKPLLERLLCKEPEERYQSAAEAEADFDVFIKAWEEQIGHPIRFSELVGAVEGSSSDRLDPSVTGDAPLTQDRRTLASAYGAPAQLVWESPVGPVYEGASIYWPGKRVALTLASVSDYKSPDLAATARESLREQVGKHQELSIQPDYPQALIAPRALTWFGDGAVAIESDPVDGFALQDLIRARRRFKFVEVLPLLRQLAEALTYVSEHGLPVPALYDYQIFITFPAGTDGKTTDELINTDPRDWPTPLLKLSPLRFPADLEQSMIESKDTAVMETIGGMADAGRSGQSPAALFAATVYRLVNGSPVADAAFLTPNAFTNTRGLGPEANIVLQNEISTHHSVAGGCMGLLKELCQREGVRVPERKEIVSTVSQTIVTAPSVPEPLSVTRIQSAGSGSGGGGVPGSATETTAAPPMPMPTPTLDEPGPGWQSGGRSWKKAALVAAIAIPAVAAAAFGIYQVVAPDGGNDAPKKPVATQDGPAGGKPKPAPEVVSPLAGAQAAYAAGDFVKARPLLFTALTGDEGTVTRAVSAIENGELGWKPADLEQWSDPIARAAGKGNRAVVSLQAGYPWSLVMRQITRANDSGDKGRVRETVLAVLDTPEGPKRIAGEDKVLAATLAAFSPGDDQLGSVITAVEESGKKSALEKLMAWADSEVGDALFLKLVGIGNNTSDIEAIRIFHEIARPQSSSPADQKKQAATHLVRALEELEVLSTKEEEGVLRRLVELRPVLEEAAPNFDAAKVLLARLVRVVDLDNPRALKLLLEVREENRPPHYHHHVGSLYSMGASQDPDPMARAIEEFNQGAQNDDPHCGYALAECYLHGLGVPQDLDKAFGILEPLARKSGMPPEVYLKAGEFLDPKSGIPFKQKDLATAREDYVKAFEAFQARYEEAETYAAGNRSKIFSGRLKRSYGELARMHLMGWGTKRNPEEAMRLLEKGYEADDAQSLMLWALVYLQSGDPWGDNRLKLGSTAWKWTPSTEKEAIRRLQKAASRGLPNAAELLRQIPPERLPKDGE